MPTSARHAAVAALLFAATLGAAPASACVVVVSPYRTSLWEKLWDWKPPAPASFPTVQIKRGQGPRGSYSTSCDDIGAVVLEFAADLPDEPVGYAFEVLEGKAPAGLLPDGPLGIVPRRNRERQIVLSWIDGATDEQEPLNFVLGIRTVDWAGNKSRETARVTVRDPGREG